MKQLFFLLLFFSNVVCAQKNTENTRLLDNLKRHITFLSNDKLEGRRTGSKGEKMAYKYIISEFRKAGIEPLHDINKYLQPFEVNEGREIVGENSFIMNSKPLTLHTDYFPFAFSGNGKVKLFENDRFYGEILNIGSLLIDNRDNPHFDLHQEILNKAWESIKNGKRALVIMNTSALPDNLTFDRKDKTPSLSLPVIYLNTKKAGEIDFSDADTIIFKVTVNIKNMKRTGHNVIGFIDNNAANTVVLGAHYDHLGYGEDHNSLYTGQKKMIHNGADDNASGTAALIELAKMIKRSGLKNNNYLFVAFSGEELGLYGSKYFVEHLPAGAGKINYMLNMDMLGRLNEETHGLTIGGYGTSPEWNSVATANDSYLKIKIDSSGSGPSDHTSFYRKDIPVLFFFTGAHKDYHKPSDDAEYINYAGEAQVIRYIYEVIERADSKGKMGFLKTREGTAMGKSSFKVTLGIMPDYTFSGNGVLVDGISEGRSAQKAGIKTGDVLYQLGDHIFSDVQGYMKALNHFNKGEATKVKVRRGKEDLVLNISF